MHWDFALILIFFATAVPWLGRRRIRRLIQGPPTTTVERLALYASTVVFQWIAVAIILWRTTTHHVRSSALGLSVPRVELAVVISILLAGLIFVNQIVSLRRLATHPKEAHGLLPQLALRIFPQSFSERLAFLVVVATVAFCEELIYRGFVQRVFEDWSGGWVVVGIIGSAVLFSVAHWYQGRRGMASTLVVGVIFSVVRAWSGSLVPSMVAHFVADLTAGLLAPSRVRQAMSIENKRLTADGEAGAAL